MTLTPCYVSPPLLCYPLYLFLDFSFTVLFSVPHFVPVFSIISLYSPLHYPYNLIFRLYCALVAFPPSLYLHFTLLLTALHLIALIFCSYYKPLS